MKGKLPLPLLLLLTMTLLSVSGFDFSPSEVSSVRAYSAKPLFRIPDPIIYGDVIYAVGGQGDTLLAFSLRGEQLWSQRVGGFIATPPLLIPDVTVTTARREAWVVVLTESQELRAYDAKTGGLRIYSMILPSPPARVSLQYTGDGKTVIIPLQSSVEVIDIRTKSEIWFKNLTFRVAFLKYIDGNILVIGEKRAALLDMGGNLRWERGFESRIEAFGADSNYLALLLENKTLMSLDLRSGAHRSRLDLSGSLGYAAPGGEFPVIDGTATLTGSSGVIHQVDLRRMELRRSMKTWVEPVRQPLIVEKALLYFGRGGLLRVYHLPSGIRLYDLKMGEEVGSDVSLRKDPVNRSYYLAVFGESGTLRVFRFPELWLKLLEVREEGGGYLIEGYICSTAETGPTASISIYTLDSGAKPLGEKPVGSVGPGQCGARFSTFLPSRGAVGLISGGFRFPPNLVVGMSADEWISMRPGAVTTTRPEVVPSLSYEAPGELRVGDSLVVKLRGINGWNATNITLLLTGDGVEETSERLKAGYGERFEMELRSVAKRESEGVRLILLGDGAVLLEETLSVTIKRGMLVDSLQLPSQVKLNESFIVNLTVVNRYEDGQQFRVALSLGEVTEEKITRPLAAGESQALEFSFRPKSSGTLQVVARVLSQDGAELEERRASILVIQPETQTSVQPPVTQTATQSAPAFQIQIPMEYLVASVLVLMVLAVVALMVRPRRPRKVEVIIPKEVPPPEAPREVPEEVPLEEIPFEFEEEGPPIPMEEIEKEEIERPEVPLEEIERPSAPRIELPAGEVLRLEEDLKNLREKLEGLKGKLEELESLIGFEVSPYRMVDAEASLVNAELRLREGKLEEAERLVRSTRESLNVLAEEVKEAERVFRDNWGAVENRIEIMLRVWGKAPATMLTMVPPSFRIAALERYMRMHKERRLELRGDELISTS